MKQLFRKPTLILILGLLMLIIGIPYGIYGLTLNGGASLGGALILLTDFAILVIIIIDRAIVQIINPRKLSFLDLFVIFLFISFYVYNQKTLIIDIENEEIEYLIILENPGNLQNTKSSYKFPFDKKLTTNKNFIIVNKVFDNIEHHTKAGWENSYYYNKYTFEKYPVVKLYSNTKLNIDKEMSEEFIDRLINNK